jgi:hypothetical protein
VEETSSVRTVEVPGCGIRINIVHPGHMTYRDDQSVPDLEKRKNIQEEKVKRVSSTMT